MRKKETLEVLINSFSKTFIRFQDMDSITVATVHTVGSSNINPYTTAYDFIWWQIDL